MQRNIDIMICSVTSTRLAVGEEMHSPARPWENSPHAAQHRSTHELGPCGMHELLEVLCTRDDVVVEEPHEVARRRQRHLQVEGNGGFDVEFGLAWFGLVWFGLVWFGLVWFGLVWFGLVWFGLAWLGLVWFGLVWFGLVWFGLVWFGLVWFGFDFVSFRLPT